MAYKNPIPRVDAGQEFVIKTVFKFEEHLTAEEAIKGITEVISKAIMDNNGELPLSWIIIKDFGK
jgi:hypothetical protein